MKGLLPCNRMGFNLAPDAGGSQGMPRIVESGHSPCGKIDALVAIPRQHLKSQRIISRPAKESNQHEQHRAFLAASFFRKSSSA
jgi:hypothetical protein